MRVRARARRLISVQRGPDHADVAAMMKMDWKEAAFHARQRPLSLALAGGTVFFACAGLLALAAGNMDLALAGAMVMILFYLLTLVANAEN